MLQWLAAEGVASAVLNLHHRPNTITRLVGHGTNSGLTVRYSWEPTILGTAGGPRRALPLLGDRFFVINGDTLTDVDLPALSQAHNNRGASVSLVVTANPTPHRYGGVVVNEHGSVQGFTGSGPHVHPHFVGVQLVEASVFANLEDGAPVASIGGIYDTLMRKQPDAVHAYSVPTSFHEVGTPADYLATSLAIAKSDGLSSLPLGERSTVDTTASVTRTVVWDDVVVEAGCCVVDCVIADGVRLPKDTQCKRQVITVASNQSPMAGRRLRNLWLSPLDP